MLVLKMFLSHFVGGFSCRLCYKRVIQYILCGLAGKDDGFRSVAQEPGRRQCFQREPKMKRENISERAEDNFLQITLSKGVSKDELETKESQ